MLFKNVAIAGLAHIDAPVTLTSDQINLELKPTMERLGIGPEACMARNPKLVYGRMKESYEGATAGDLAREITDGSRLALLGIGSGLTVSMMDVVW